ncbi:hypothetical protein GA0115246_115291 [Streptomyces sp. SolWspMP-sol7th]|nr:hypothetical protein GA0115246_115291 [Streptomyces sp. SolWspMP-sol7th]
MRVEEMANDVVAQQSSEIHRMEALAKGWSGASARIERAFGEG